MGVQINEDRYGLVQIKLTPSQVGANTTSEQDFTLPGIRASDHVTASKSSHTTGIALVNARVKAKGIMSLTFANVTGSPITPPAELYLVHWHRGEHADSQVVDY
jgi:hypothetical protein